MCHMVRILSLSSLTAETLLKDGVQCFMISTTQHWEVASQPSTSHSFITTSGRLQRPYFILSRIGSKINMSYTPTTPSYALISSPTVGPNAFNIFSFSQNPRESHLMFEDLGFIFRASSGRQGGRKRSNSTPSITSGLKKLLRL